MKKLGTRKKPTKASRPRAKKALLSPSRGRWAAWASLSTHVSSFAQTKRMTTTGRIFRTLMYPPASPAAASITLSRTMSLLAGWPAAPAARTPPTAMRAATP
jgi:hypothetical protein